MVSSTLSPVLDQLRRAVLLRDGASLTDGQLLESFLSQKDEEAFAALVRRHGPMVLGVCRRVLHNHHDAEDAFQATFLVLVRKADAIVPREMVANWLHGVAYRTALKARTMIARQRVRERQATEMPEPETAEPDNCWRNLESLLDQELSRLPDKYRVPIVLCDLEGKTGKAAARELGWPEGTVASRLSRGRALLAKRLTRNGLAFSGGTLAAVLSEKVGSACVPVSTMAPTIQAANRVAGGNAVAAGAISARVAALTKGMVQTMFLNKIKMAAAALLVLGMVGFGGVLYVHQAGGQQDPAPRSATVSEQQDAAGEPTAKGGETPKGKGDGQGKTRPNQEANEADRLLLKAFGKESAALKLPIKMVFKTPNGRMVLATDTFDLALDGRVSLYTCYLASFPKDEGRPVVLLSSNEAQLPAQLLFNTPIRQGSDLRKSNLVLLVVSFNLTPVGRVGEKPKEAKERETPSEKPDAGKKNTPAQDGGRLQIDDLRGKWTGEKNGIKVDLTFHGEQALWQAHWQVAFRATQKPHPQLPPTCGVNKGADLRGVADAKAGCLNLYLPKYLGDKKEYKQNPSWNGLRPVGKVERGAEGTIQLRMIPTGYENLDQGDFDYPAVESLILHRVAEPAKNDN